MIQVSQTCFLAQPQRCVRLKTLPISIGSWGTLSRWPPSLGSGRELLDLYIPSCRGPLGDTALTSVQAFARRGFKAVRAHRFAGQGAGLMDLVV